MPPISTKRKRPTDWEDDFKRRHPFLNKAVDFVNWLSPNRQGDRSWTNPDYLREIREIRDKNMPKVYKKKRWGRRKTRRSYRKSYGKKGSSGRGVTTQYDKSSIYKRRVMRGGKKRAWKSFVRKVHAVLEKDLGTRTIVRNNVGGIVGPVANNLQGVYEVCLYGFKSGNPNADLSGGGFGQDDIATIVNNDTSIPATGAIRFRSGVLDLTIRNATGIATTGEGGVANVRPRIELDIYEITASKLTSYFTLAQALQDGFGATPNIDTATQLDLTVRGVTPFDCPAGLSTQGVKIWKKTKFMMAPDETITYQIRDPRSHFMTKQKINQSEIPSGYNYPKMTKTLLIIAKTVPGWQTTVPATAGAPVRIQMGVTRKYTYTVMREDNEREGGL